MITYKNFITQLMMLGNNDIERADKLGTSIKTISRYRNGILPKPITQLMQHPDLLHALAEDARYINSDQLNEVEAGK